MKKIYNNPKIEVIKIQTVGMLAESVTKSGSTSNPSDLLGHDDDFDW